MPEAASRRRLLDHLKPPSWFTPAIATDWLIAVILLLVNKRYFERALPFQQPLGPFIDDPTLQYKHVTKEHVPGFELVWTTFMMPLALVLLISIARRSLVEAHFSVLSIFFGYQLNSTFTNFIKMQVGRLRPDFWDRCQWDAGRAVCTGIPAVIQEGRRSFPSGHSSGSFYGCVFLMLFLAGKSRAFAFSGTYPSSGILHSRLLRFVIAISPLFLSLYVAISRWEDHWHHPTDRSLLGTIIAIVTYHIWWPSPFASANVEVMGYPRKMHVLLEESADNLESSEDEIHLLGDAQV